MYLTTIATSNQAALRLLTSGRAGLPCYEPAGDFHTFALPLRRHATANRSTKAEWEIRRSNSSDLPAIREFLDRHARARQFFPCLEVGDYFSESGGSGRLQASDLWLAERKGDIIGTMASWNQTSHRQTVVHGYSGFVRILRRCYNAFARGSGRPTLPSPGQSLRSLTLALPVVAETDPQLPRALIGAVAAHHASSGLEIMLLGLHERDPLFAAARDWRGVRYKTRLFLVYWPDGESLVRELDGRSPYLELGCL